MHLTSPAAAETKDGRLLTVTMTKATPTKGSNHWRSAIKGEGVIDTSAFGPAIVTVNPNDPAAIAAVLDDTK